MCARALRVWFCVLGAGPAFCGEAVEIKLDPPCVRSIGGVSTFRREQFITIHATPYESELTDADLEFLEKELEVSYGRDGGSRSWNRRITRADPKRPDFPDLVQLRKRCATSREERDRTRRGSPELTRGVILCTHPETFYARKDNTSAPWGPRMQRVPRNSRPTSSRSTGAMPADHATSRSSTSRS